MESPFKKLRGERVKGYLYLYMHVNASTVICRCYYSWLITSIVMFRPKEPSDLDLSNLPGPHIYVRIISDVGIRMVRIALDKQFDLSFSDICKSA